MPRDDELLRSITTFPKLVKYLRDELEWPIEETSFEDLTFDYEPEELGLDPKTAVKIRSIKQLRPLAASQPWGIFFVEFERKRLPVVVMRLVLSALTLKSRASAGKSSQAAWRASDLLFLSSYGEEGGRGITFAHFAPDEQGHDLPALKVLGWDGDDTKLHTRAVAESLASNLVWPSDEKNVQAWRTQWSSAFVLPNRYTAETSRELSMKLAQLAIGIRERAKAILAAESERGPLRRLQDAFKQALLHDLDEDGFADMYAQTVAYGLLAAKLENPDSPTPLTASALADMIPATSPFLKGLLSTFLKVGGRKGYLDFDQLGIRDVVDLLRNADMKAILLDFGDLKPEEDPVLHFYELFLNEYDHAQKVSRGVFYTPKPVVHYIVHSVDEIVRTEFGLTDGLADTTTWGEMVSRRPELTIPTGLKPSEPFVQVLDPATGTATFLVEVIDVIYSTMTAKWRSQGKSKTEMEMLWNEYVPRHLLPRLYGFELQMAPYTIAHIKVGLKLRETGYRFESTQRLRIYLTNTLEDPADFSDPLGLLLPVLAEEARAVTAVKRSLRPTVVLGNPPYSGASSNKGEWISELIDDYKQVDGKPLGEKNPKMLQDDYVKFIRFAQWKIDGTGVGVLGFITNHSYLDNLTFRGMRQSLMQSFRQLHVLDLHGNSLKKERCPDGSKDENVFDIMQGVAIMLAVERKGLQRGAWYTDLWGARNAKYKALAEQQDTHTTWSELKPRRDTYLLVPQDVSLASEYELWPSVTDIFNVQNAGLYTSRDELTIWPTPDQVWKTVNQFVSMPPEDARATFHLGSDARDWKVEFAQEDVRGSGPSRKRVVRILYRPFDVRYTYYTGHSRGFLCMPRPDVMRHMLEPNIALCVGRAGQVVGDSAPWNVCLCSDCIDDYNLFYRGGNVIMPLYRYETSGATAIHSTLFDQRSGGAPARVSNLSTDILNGIDEFLGSRVRPESVLSHIYAILNSPTYRVRYAPFLKAGFPRVPFAKNHDTFTSLARLGQRLMDLHLMHSPDLDSLVSSFCGKGDSAVTKVEYNADLGRVSINPTQYFEGVTPDLWTYQIGGYQVLQKWLKDRRPRGGEPGRVLSLDEILHYRKIVTAIAKTIELQAEIDQVIAAAGGFPAAFASPQAP